MRHKLSVGQAVVPAFRGDDRSDVYEIVRLMPADAPDAPQYEICCRSRGIRRFVREAEISAAFPSSPRNALAAGDSGRLSPRPTRSAE